MTNKSLNMKQFPLANKYDLDWMFKNEMGPNSIWLMEFLSQKLDLNSNMRVLDLGCGRAMSSIFLAKEYNVQVFAADLWINPTDNLKRIKEFNLEDKIFPIKVAAHDLPFAEGFFDIITSIDAYHYFGTDELYLQYILKFLKPGGQIGIVVPGLKKEFSFSVPKELKKEWENEFFTFHSTSWWENHWNKTGLLDIEIADELENSWSIWMKWEKELKKSDFSKRNGDLDLLKADNGKYLTFPRIVARKK